MGKTLLKHYLSHFPNRDSHNTKLIDILNNEGDILKKKTSLNQKLEMFL